MNLQYTEAAGGLFKSALTLAETRYRVAASQATRKVSSDLTSASVSLRLLLV
jgi:hypothetical protein